MENKAHAVIAGLFTLLMVAAAILIAVWLGRERTVMVPFQMATTRSVPGLQPQAAVRYRGLDVGLVEAINFDPKVTGQILVSMKIKTGTPITRSTYGMLGYQGVTGIAYVELDDDGSSKELLPSSEQQVARIAMRPSLLDQLQDRGLAILVKTDALASSLNQLMTPENQKTMLAAFENISRAATEIENIPRQLKPTLDRLPALTRETQLTMASLNKLSGSLNQMSSNLQGPDGAITKLSTAADDVSLAASQIEVQVQPLSREIRGAIRSLNRTLDNLNERPQSLLFGSPAHPPGPGEPGFSTAPTAGSK